MNTIKATVWAYMLLVSVGGVEAAMTWTRLDYPGAQMTYANGVSGGTVVGGYTVAGGVMRAFTYNNGTWTSLDYPGMSWTWARGIYGNRIVGYYSTGPFQDYGFVYDGTTWTTLPYPCRAYGIYENRIVGYYEDGSSRAHGFVYDGTTWKTLNYPGARDTVPYGIWGDTIVGFYVDAYYEQHGFIYNGKNWRTVAQGGYPGGVEGSRMVGCWLPNGASETHGLLIDGQTWTDLQCPWGPRTEAYGISGDSIVGIYRETPTGPSRGFLLTLPEPGTLGLLAVSGLLALSAGRKPAHRRLSIR